MINSAAKRFFFLLLITILLTNCDPVIPIIIQNHTGDPVTITVRYDNRYDFNLDSLSCTKKPVERFKTIRKDSLELRIPIEKLGDDKYRFLIENDQAILLEPRAIGLPIKEIFYQSKLHNDTISSAYSFQHENSYESKIKIEKKGAYTRLIILKK